MPEAQTPAQKLLLEELGEGPGSRLLLMSLRGSDPAILARQSQALREVLAGQPQVFELVANGAHVGLRQFRPDYCHTAICLVNSFDAAPLDVGYLKQALQMRVQDFGVLQPRVWLSRCCLGIQRWKCCMWLSVCSR